MENQLEDLRENATMADLIELQLCYLHWLEYCLSLPGHNEPDLDAEHFFGQADSVSITATYY